MTSSRPNRFVARSSFQVRWALAALLAVVVVLGATLGLRAIVGHARRATLVTAAPLGPLRVAAVTAPGTSYEHLALDTAAGHLVALAGAVPLGCPPTDVCTLSSAATTFVVLDGTSGAPLASVPLSGPVAAAAQATILLADPTTHSAYAVAPGNVSRFATTNGHYEGGFALPAALGGTIDGATLDTAQGALAVASVSTLVVVDASSGAVRASLAVPGLAAGPVLDPATQRLFVLAHDASGTTLMAFDAATLAPLGQLAVPSGTLGPLDSADNALLLFGADGTDYRIALGSRPLSAGSLNAAPDLHGTLAAGWNPTLGHTYRVTPAGLEALDTRAGTLRGTLPLTALQPAALPLALDAARGLVYLPATDGAVVIVRDSPNTAGALDAATALLLARAALPHFLPDTNQDPPFVASDTFPLAMVPTAAGVAHNFWIHFSDLGWKGPYPGSAGSAVAADPHHPGGYLVTFRIAWYQLFARSHTWVCAVATDGTVSLQSESGDAVP